MSYNQTRREFLHDGLVAAAAMGRSAPRFSTAPPRSRDHARAWRFRLGKPTFFMDGEPFTSPVFETYVPELRYFHQLAGAGCRVFSFSTNLGPGFRAATWLAPDHWDFSDLDLLAHRVLDARGRCSDHAANLPRDPRLVAPAAPRGSSGAR